VRPDRRSGGHVDGRDPDGASTLCGASDHRPHRYAGPDATALDGSTVNGTAVNGTAVNGSAFVASCVAIAARAAQREGPGKVVKPAP
jgi:hypothetical protein